ncbi:choice-of-anchor D domain-containing protein [bacterium]|nr:choice-of-anchor D domain-containing protein [bacterium]
MILASSAFAQPFPPDSVWTFSFDDGGDEYFYDAIEVEDGFLLCGEAREWNALAGDGIIVKLNRDGELVWERRYGQSQRERFPAIVKRGPNDYLLGCERLSANGESSRLLVYEIDDFGNVNVTFWHELGQVEAYPVRMGGMSVPGSHNFATSYSLELFQGERMFALEISDRVGNSQIRYYSTGALNENSGHTLIDSTTFESVLFGKTRAGTADDSDGLLEYDDGISAAHGGAGDDGFLGARLDAMQSRVVATGFTTLDGSGSDLWVTATGLHRPDSVIWSRHYGGLSYEDGVEIINASDSGFIIAGNFSSENINFEQSDYWLLKVDEDGDSVWSVVKGGDEADRCEGMIETENGFLLFGSSQSFAVPGWDGCAMLLAYVPDIAATPGSLNFGPVAVGLTATRTLGLINTGSNVLTVTEIQGSGDYSTAFTGPATVEIGDTLRVDILFTPQSVGNHVDTLRIFSNAISGVKTVRCLGAGTAANADEESLLPTEFKLHPPYPNPFNPTTTIAFDMPTTQSVALNLYDVSGRLVRELVQQEFAAGRQCVSIDGKEMASGIYFVSMVSGEFQAAQKLVLMK